MRRILLAALLLAGQRASAQAPPDTLNAQQRHEAKYSTLDSARITTGVLLDRTVPFSAVRRLDGTRDTAASYANWRQMHLEFWNASLRRETLPTPAAADQRLYQAPKLPGIPLRVLHYRYQQLLPDAEALGRIRTDTVARRLYDVAGAESPYVVRRALALGCPLKRVYADTIPFYVGADQFFGNVRPDSATLRVDFGDGQGLRLVTLGQVVTVAYPTRGDKIIRLRWEQHGQVMQAATGLRVSFVPAPDRAFSITATNAWPGQTEFGRARAYVAAGVGNPKVWDNGRWVQKICKPLVFVEGIDFGPYGNEPGDSTFSVDDNGSYANPPFRYGEAGWPLMQEYDEEYKSLEKLPDMRQRLQNLGYDVIYLDFNDGEALIQQNAMALVQLLRWLKDPANRTPNCANNDVVVLGASMGGQVSRFALTWMEQQQEPHCASLYVSFDSPHYGASVPVGLQHLIHDLSSIAFLTADDEISWDRDKLRSPGAQQMLRLHFDANNSPTWLGNEWKNWQENAANWPAQLRKVAVANGRINGVSQPHIADQLLLQTNVLGAGILGHKETYSVPGRTIRRNLHPDEDNVVYFDRNGLLGSAHFVHVDPQTPYWDFAPGCIARVAETIYDNGSAFFNANYIPHNSFMPTISTLGIHAAAQASGGPNFWYNIPVLLPDAYLPNPARYRFDAYFAPNDDEPHVQITDGTGSAHGNTSYYSNNSEWILQELREVDMQLPAVLAAGTPNVTYHYGNQYHKLLGSTTINAGGQLFVNKYGLPVSGGPLTAQHGQFPTAGLFTLLTRGCGATVTVNTGGLFEVGTPGATAAGYTAEVQFLNGSVLDINGGTLVINSNSTIRMRAGSVLLIGGTMLALNASNIIIEPGAQLIVRPGAQFVLQDPDSHLTLQGGFRIGSGATFQPTGNGYVVFDLPDGNGNNNLEIDGSTSRFILRGSGPSHVMARLAPGTHLQPTFWGDFEFTIENGAVEMGEDAWINCADARVRLVNATFKGERSASRYGYRFVMVRNYQRETIRLCRFEGAQTGLLAALNASTSSYVPMYDNLTFTNCRIGLHSDGNGLRLRNCYFDNTGYDRGLAGWRMDNTFSADNRAEHVTAKNFDDGLLFYGGAGAVLTVVSPQITNNVHGITFHGEGTLQGECGAVFHNNHGLWLEGPVTLNLSNGSQLSVVDNGYDGTGGQGGGHPASPSSRNIDVVGARELNLERGHNDFTGRVPQTAGITGHLVTLSTSPPATLSANGNRWNIREQAPVNQAGDANVNWLRPRGTSSPYIVEDNQPAPTPYCDVDPCVVPVRPGVYVKCWDTQSRCSTCETVTTPYVTADSLHRAVARAMSYRHTVDSTSTDAVAIQMLKAILTHPLADTTAEEAQILEKAYRALQEIYASSLDDNQAQAYANRAALNQVIDAKLAAAIADSGIVNPVFYLLMDKALAAHAAGDLAGARVILEEARAQANPLTQGFYDYWDCSLAATQDLRDSLITDIEYFERLLTCSQPRSAGRGVQPQSIEGFLAEQDAKTAARRAAQQAKATAQARIQLAPNPTTGAVTVSLADAPTGPVTLTLRDLTGQVVRRWERTATVSKANAWTLDLAGVAQGVYLIEVGTTARTEMRRLVIGTGGPASRP